MTVKSLSEIHGAPAFLPLPSRPYEHTGVLRSDTPPDLSPRGTQIFSGTAPHSTATQASAGPRQLLRRRPRIQFLAFLTECAYTPFD